MSISTVARRDTTERKRVIVVQKDPSIGCRIADWFAMRGYQAILTRSIEDVQPDLPQIHPDVIVFSLDSAGGSRTLPHLQSMLPYVPIIAMAPPHNLNRQLWRKEQALAFGAGVFLCGASDRDESVRLVQ
jgi:DNA-binding NtrC family response regulator